MKKFLQLLVSLFGYNIIKSSNFYKINRTLDQAIKSIIKKKNPIIFDVGAHEGESIDRFRNLFQNPIIHSFEPQSKTFEKLMNKKKKTIKTWFLIISHLVQGKKIKRYL